MGKIIIIAVVSVLFLGGFIVWQKNNSTAPNQQANDSENTKLESDHSLESTIGGSPSFIEDLRKRKFIGGEIKIEETLSHNDTYTSYLISYPSDNLKIYGVMNVPKGTGPFPVVVLNHGYYSPAAFKSGDGTTNIANVLAPHGFITLASDYRGHGNSENDNRSRGGHRPEYTIDVINLIASIKTIPEADTTKIGMWGHSMGGEVSLRAIEAMDQVRAVVLWAPTSGNAAENHAFYNRNKRPTENPALKGVSPINYLQYIKAPISIHQGLDDSEVRPEWSKELYNALQGKGKTVEYFEYEGQDHNFRNLGWDEISERTIAFFDKYLKK